jgi:type IX secretion system PorP/SprF family membrane protein
MKTKIFLIAIFASACSVLAQNDIQLSQQSFTRLYYNPAATGQNEGSIFNFITRYQWVNVNDAPVTMLANYQHYFQKYHFAAGLNVVNDKLGLENNYNIKAAYSYRVYTGENCFLSFGIGAGVLSKNIDFGRIVYEEAEPANYTFENKWKPDFDAGIEMNWKYLTLGTSVTHINNSENAANLYTVPRHYYFYSRGIISVNENFAISPSFSINSCSYRTQYEFNLSSFINKTLYTGLSYRLNESFVVLAGVQINETFRINYSFDMNAGAFNNTMSGGSHEVLLQIKLGGKNDVIQASPRFFD